MKILHLCPVYWHAWVAVKTDKPPYVLPLVAIAVVEKDTKDGGKSHHLASIALTGKSGLQIIDETDSRFNGHSYDV